MLRDACLALRALLRAPAFAASAILCVALGVGANAAIFSVVDVTLLRPLPYRDAGRLVVVWERRLDRPGERNVASPANFLDWRAAARSFDALGATYVSPRDLTGDGEPEAARVQGVTPAVLGMLGVPPAIGRALRVEDAAPGAPAVVLLGDALWRRRYGADPGVVGRSITLGGRAATVVGVMPPRFRVLDIDADLWAPIVLSPAVDYRAATGRFLTVVGRLRPGVTREAAAAELAAIAARLAVEHPSFNANWGVNVVGLREQLVGAVRRPLLILSGVVAFVLLIACANVAGLQLARAAARRREMTVRAALGASRWRIARTVVAEALVLSTAGGALGLLLAEGAVSALAAAGPAGLVHATELAVDGRVVAFTAAVSLLAGLLFAVVPALSAARGALGQAMREGGRGTAGTRHAPRRALVGAQAALSVVLLVGAGLMLKSVWRLQRVDPGFRPEGVVTARLALPAARYPEPEQAARHYAGLAERVAALPGVRAAGATSSLPLLGATYSATGVAIAGRPRARPGEGAITSVTSIAGDYFRAMGIPVRRGAAFTGAEPPTGPKQVIVNEAFVAEHFPHEDPIGRHLLLDWGEELDGTIVGVVGDTHQLTLDSLPRPATYWPVAQLPSSQMTLVARHDGPDAAPVVAGMRAVVKDLDPQLPLADVKTMDAYVSESVARRRLSAALLAGFAGAALLLAAVGVYGVVAYAVTQRTREIGVRVALGSTRRAVLQLVVGQELRAVLAGGAAGLAAALALTRVLTTQLYDVSPTDAPTFVGVPLLLAVTAAVACVAPALRAVRVEPQAALREE